MFGYGCANYSKENPDSCRFAIGKIAGVSLKEAQVKELLLRGKTDVIKGICGEDRHEVRRAAEADAGRADRI